MNAFPDEPAPTPVAPEAKRDADTSTPENVEHSSGALITAAGPMPPDVMFAEVVPAEPHDPPWSGWDVLRIVLMGAVALVLIFIALAFTVTGANLRTRLNTLNARPELLIVGQMVAYLLILGYMYVLVTRERRQPHFWQAIRWNWPARIWTYLLLGFLMQAAFMVVERFLPFPKEMPFDAVLRRPYSVVLISIFSVTLGPLLEEIFFRGFFYPVLKRRIGVAAAIVVTAFPFALMHAAQYGNSWASILLIFVVGVVLATVRETNDSLAASFLVHVGYNGTIMLILFAATDGFRHLEKLNQ